MLQPCSEPKPVATSALLLPTHTIIPVTTGPPLVSFQLNVSLTNTQVNVSLTLIEAKWRNPVEVGH